MVVLGKRIFTATTSSIRRKIVAIDIFPATKKIETNTILLWFVQYVLAFSQSPCLGLNFLLGNVLTVPQRITFGTIFGWWMKLDGNSYLLEMFTRLDIFEVWATGKIFSLPILLNAIHLD